MRPPTYVADLMKFLDQLGIADAVFVGTSLGGLCTMLLAATDNERIAGALINDIGPDIDQTGIDRIAGYVGQDTRFASWEEAHDLLSSRNAEVFPRWGKDEWSRFTRRICTEEDGIIRFDYDMGIKDNFGKSAGKPQPDAWPLYRCLDGRPVTILRGELSDLLSEETAEKMVARDRRRRTRHRSPRRAHAQFRRARKRGRARPPARAGTGALAGDPPQLVERHAVRLLRRDRRDELAGLVHQERRRGMVDAIVAAAGCATLAENMP